LCFVLSNNVAISSSGEKIILKNISADEEFEEADEFHDFQKCLRQSGRALARKFQKKKIHGFCMCFKFKVSILRFLFAFCFFCFSFLFAF